MKIQCHSKSTRFLRIDGEEIHLDEDGTAEVSDKLGRKLINTNPNFTAVKKTKSNEKETSDE